MGKDRRPKKRIIKGVPKACYFCTDKKEPTFEDTGTLQRFLTERGKIIPRSRDGLCAKHQKSLAKNVKYARHLALLSFVVRG
ncbi:MAG: 30S ribosomal protein S18 [Patescibacteria group bacterium]